MSEESDTIGGDWFRYGESRFGNMDPMQALTELDIQYTNAGPQNQEGLFLSPKVARAVASMKEADLIRWVNIMAPDHNPKVVEFYTNRALKLYSGCRAYIEGLEE